MTGEAQSGWSDHGSPAMNATASMTHMSSFVAEWAPTARTSVSRSRVRVVTYRSPSGTKVGQSSGFLGVIVGAEMLEHRCGHGLVSRSDITVAVAVAITDADSSVSVLTEQHHGHHPQPEP